MKTKIPQIPAKHRPSTPIHIRLTKAQTAQIVDFQRQGQVAEAEVARINKEYSAVITSIVAGVVEPAKVQGWDIKVDDKGIHLTPKKKK